VGDLVSFATIIKKLIPGSYDTLTGHPQAEERFREFVEEVKRKVEELKYLPDEDVEDRVLEAIDWARHSICSKVYDWEHVSEAGDYYEGVILYSCNHPTTGKFYMVIHEMESADVGEAYFGFHLTRDYRNALRKYSETKRHLEERIKGY
jgi:hypothetical protein